MAKSLARVAFASLLLALTVFGSKAESSSGGVGPDASCASSSPCLSVQNSGTGTAVEGKSTAGNGISGVTKTASSSSFLGSGVEGDDLGSGSYNAGVLGTSTNGIGVYGTSANHIGIAGIGGVGSLVGQSSTPGVVGEVANQSFGLFGVGTTGVQVQSPTDTSPAIFVKSQNGRLLRANNSSGIDVFVVDGSGHLTIGSASLPGTYYDLGTAYNTNFMSAGGLGPEPQVGVTGHGYGIAGYQIGTGDAIFANGYGGLLFRAIGSSGNDVFTVDDTGTVLAHSFNSILMVVRRPTGSGSAVLANVARATQPAIEDTGQAQLRDGEAWVPLDRRFSAAIDAGAGYLVFLSAQGESRGLFTTSKAANGFAVRECRGGKASLPFWYRVVAKPFASHAGRLAPMRPLPSGRRVPPTHWRPQ